MTSAELFIFMISIHMSVVSFTCTNSLQANCTCVLLSVREVFTLKMTPNIVLCFVHELSTDGTCM